MEPSFNTAQVWYWLDETLTGNNVVMPPGFTNDTGTGVDDATVLPVPNCPNELEPQQDMLPSSRMAHVCSEPAAIESWVKIDPDWKPGSFAGLVPLLLSKSNCSFSEICPLKIARQETRINKPVNVSDWQTLVLVIDSRKVWRLK